MKYKSKIAIYILFFQIIICNNISAQWLWAQSKGGSLGDEGSALCTDLNNNIYLAGAFKSDSISFGTFNLFNSGGSDSYVTKLDQSGNVLWAQSLGNKFDEKIFSIRTDNSGNIYSTGYYYSDSLTFGTSLITNAGSSDVFLIKYDNNGNELWARSVGGAGIDQGISISTDPFGNSYIAGQYASNSLTLGSIVVNNVGTSYNLFLAKYDSSGNAVWARSFGTNGIEYTSSLTYKSGSLYLTGNFLSTFLQFGNIMLNNGGNADMYLCKFDTTGTPIWAQNIAGAMADYGLSVAVDNSDQVYVAGNFAGSVNFGISNLTSSGGIDLFIAKADNLNNNILNDPALIGMEFYPNPSNDFIRFNLIGNNFSSLLSIIDITGRVIDIREIKQNDLIAINRLSPGIYFLQLTNENNIIGMKRLIKQ